MKKHLGKQMIFNEWLQLKEVNLINPETNKRYEWSDRYKLVKKYVDEEIKKGVNLENIWIHFSDIPKLGINVRSSYQDTPLGIYAYPVKLFLLQPNYSNTGSKRKYIVLFKSNQEKTLKANRDDMVDMKLGSNVSLGDVYTNCINSIKNRNMESDETIANAISIAHEIIDSFSISNSGLPYVENMEQTKYAIKYAIDKTKNTDQKAKNIASEETTKHMNFYFKNKDVIEIIYQKEIQRICEKYNVEFEKVIDNYRKKYNYKNRSKFLYFISKTIAMLSDSSRIGITWNKILRELGINAITDIDGTGTIHNAEPQQAVFLTIEKLEIITIINNDREHKHPRFEPHDNENTKIIKGYINSINNFFYYMIDYKKGNVNYQNKIEKYFENLIKFIKQNKHNDFWLLSDFCKVLEMTEKAVSNEYKIIINKYKTIIQSIAMGDTVEK